MKLWAMGSGLWALGLATTAAPTVLAQNPPIAAPGPAAAPQRAGAGRGGIRVMTLTSSAFADGGMVPPRHAQPGRDVSPALSWSGGPDSVVSYVLIVHDADVAMGNGLDDALHWMVWNIPGTANALPEGMPQGPQVRGIIAVPASDTGAAARARTAVFAAGVRQISASGPYYRGPAAASTGPPHHYLFELYALDANVNVQPVGMSAAETREAVLETMRGHVLGKGVLVGRFRRADPPQP